MAKAPKKSEESQEVNKEESLPVERVTAGRAMSPFEEMDRFFETFFPRRWMQPFRWDMPSWSELGAALDVSKPKVDVIDRDNEVVVKAELPGVAKEDVEVTMTDSAVTIKGATSHEEKEEQGDYYRCEISRGSFSRTVPLPSDVDADNARASFRDGILELVIPKVAKSKRRNIKVE